LTDYGYQLFNSIARPLGDAFNAAVGKVANRAVNGPGHPHYECTKPDHLNPAADIDSRPDNVIGPTHDANYWHRTASDAS